MVNKGSLFVYVFVCCLLEWVCIWNGFGHFSYRDEEGMVWCVGSKWSGKVKLRLKGELFRGDKENKRIEGFWRIVYGSLTCMGHVYVGLLWLWFSGFSNCCVDF